MSSSKAAATPCLRKSGCVHTLDFAAVFADCLERTHSHKALPFPAPEKCDIRSAKTAIVEGENMPGRRELVHSTQMKLNQFGDLGIIEVGPFDLHVQR